MDRFAMDPSTIEQVCARLDVALPVDDDGVSALYRRWCELVPFDPVAKAAAMSAGRPPPGADPAEVCRLWLDTGLGSTCWGHVSTLGAILEHAGVRATVGIDRMLTDSVVDFHAFVVAHLDTGPVALDPVHVSGDPLPLHAGATGTHPLYRTGFDHDGSRLEHWFAPPLPERGPRRYTVLSTTADAGDVRAFCAVSGQFSGVTAHRFFLRRCPPEGFVQAKPDPGGRGLTVRRWHAHGADDADPLDGADGVEETHHEDVDEALHAVGYATGALEALMGAGFVHRDGDRWRWAT